MNGVQTLFLTVDNHGLIQATLSIARLSLPTHWKMTILQKKSTSGNHHSSFTLLAVEDLKTMSTRKMIQERTIDYFANYPSAIKKTLKKTEEKDDSGSASMRRGERIYFLDKRDPDHGFTGEK